MSKRVISKASKRRLSFFGPLCIISIVYFTFSLLYNVYTIYDLTNEKNKLNDLYVELQQEAEQLKIDIEKLNDPKYLADYARQNYLYSKDGEYIIQMEELENTEDKMEALSLEINKNYVILGLSVFMFFVFVYILTKGKRKQKKRR